MIHKRTKHIEVDYHFIREKLQVKKIETLFIRSKYQIMDIFTKDLKPSPFDVIVNKLVLIDIYNSNLRGVLKYKTI
jgi:hypothetical protein